MTWKWNNDFFFFFALYCRLYHHALSTREVLIRCVFSIGFKMYFIHSYNRIIEKYLVIVIRSHSKMQNELFISTCGRSSA
jgi:hypothetical protein